MASPLENLTATQAQVARALADGRSVNQAAACAGLDSATVYDWLQTSDDFRAAAEQAKQEFTSALADQVRDLSGAALESLRNLLAASDTPPAIRLRASLAILERPGFPKPGWRLPERIEPPQQQRLLDALADVEAQDRIQRLQDRAARVRH